jgi:hypothetical protein
MFSQLQIIFFHVYSLHALIYGLKFIPNKKIEWLQNYLGKKKLKKLSNYVSNLCSWPKKFKGRNQRSNLETFSKCNE